MREKAVTSGRVDYAAQTGLQSSSAFTGRLQSAERAAPTCHPFVVRGRTSFSLTCGHQAFVKEVVMSDLHPSRSLLERAHLDQQKKQARELLRAALGLRVVGERAHEQRQGHLDAALCARGVGADLTADSG